MLGGGGLGPCDLAFAILLKTHKNAQKLYRTGGLLQFWEQKTGYPTTKTKVVVAHTIAK
jgi:hypothetical protein